jgi:hypothetical protein
MKMNGTTTDCRTYRQLWNLILDRDRDGAAEPSLSVEIERHEAACASCRALGVGYRGLVRGLQGWTLPVAAPEGLADRVLARCQEEPVRGTLALFLSPARLAMTSAAAAALLIGVGLGIRYLASPPASAPISVATREPGRGELTEALERATTATLDLAAVTSAPAGRVGRLVLASSGLAGGGEKLAVTTPRPRALDAASDVLRTVGDGVQGGIRPLTGTARHAFGFLLGPSPAPPHAAETPTGRGA